MTLEFNPLPPGSSAATPGSSSTASRTPPISLQTLGPLDPSLFARGSRQAEVISALAASAGGFRLLLRLAGDGNQPPGDLTLLSQQNIATGSRLQLEQVNATSLLARLAPAAPLLTRLDPANFPAGTRVTLQITSQQALAEGKGFLLTATTSSPQAGSQLQLRSLHPVEPGTRLQAVVGQTGELKLTSVGERQRQLQLLEGLRDTLQRQAAPEQLLQRASQLLDNTSSRLPPSLNQALAQVLSQIPESSQLGTPQGLASALQRSGLFMEQGLQQLLGALKSAGNPVELARLLAAVSQLPVSAEQAAPPGADLKANLLNLLLTLQAQLPAAQIATALQAGQHWPMASQQLRPGLFPIPARALQALGETGDLGSLLRLTAALLSRIQHHQFQSLGQTQSFADGSSQTVWQLDVPMREQQQFSHIQLRIQRDDPGAEKGKKRKQPQWEIRLQFHLEQLGPLQAVAHLQAGQVSAELWAEKLSTVQLIRAEAEVLRERLQAQGLQIGTLTCRRGSPPEPVSSVQQHWIDEVT